MFSALDNAIELIATLPGIGPRSAARIAFYILRSEEHRVTQLAEALVQLRQNIRFCAECGGLSEHNVCDICSDPGRDRSLLCVVEEPGDIFAIEKTGEFSGVYHVLMGVLSPLDGVGPEDLRIRELLEKTRSDSVKEIFIATNPTLEGDTTANYIQEQLRGQTVRLTRISHGIPTGTAIEYADRNTLARSIRSRTSMEAEQ